MNRREIAAGASTHLVDNPGHQPELRIESVAPTYRRDIDGLRAIAVLSVMAFHYGAPFSRPVLPGGFTGVDVFFVISGFVITLRLSGEIALGQFSILNFYDRRAKRILPALVVMLTAMLLAGYLLLLPGDYQSLAISAAAAAFGASNFFFLLKTGYFDQSSEFLPLLHTWSLAVEEQFYLVWPLTLFFISKAGSRIATAAIIGAIVIVSFGAGLVWLHTDPKATFYMTAPRAWELAIGALLVFLPSLPRRLGSIATVVGLALIITGFVMIKATTFPGLLALYPCVGAALIVWPKEDNGPAAWLARLQPIGLISYSLYLWHWPVWVMYRIYINNDQPSIMEALMLAIASMILAALSYSFVEQPFRRHRWAPSESLKVAFLTCAVIFGGSMYVYSKDGLTNRISDEVYAMRSLDAMWAWPCKTQIIDDRLPAYCTFGSRWDSSSNHALLWGDSNAEHLAPLIDLAGKDANVAIALARECPPNFDNKLFGKSYLDIFPGYNEHCEASRNAILAMLAARTDIQTVILSAFWSMVSIDTKRMDGSLSNDRLGTFHESMRATILELTKLGKRVVLIAGVPQWEQDPVPCLLRGIGLLRRPCSDDRRILSRAFFDHFSGPHIEIFERIKREFPEITLIKPGDRWCDELSCISQLNGEILYRDQYHIRKNLQNRTNRMLLELSGMKNIFGQ